MKYYAYITDLWVTAIGCSTFIPPGALELDVPLDSLNYVLAEEGLVRSEPPSVFHKKAPGGVWVLDENLAWSAARVERDRRLAASDFIIIVSQERGVPVPDEWRVYRQALRDITQQPDPLNITWPTSPASTV